jgi:hypothetical protein
LTSESVAGRRRFSQRFDLAQRGYAGKRRTAGSPLVID